MFAQLQDRFYTIRGRGHSGRSPRCSFCLRGGSIHPPPLCRSSVACRVHLTGGPYRKRYEVIPLTQISPYLQHAVIAAEDGRSYQHDGFDWHQI